MVFSQKKIASMRGRNSFRGLRSSFSDLPHIPFDFTMCHAVFPRCTPPMEDKALNQEFIKRVKEMTPDAEERKLVADAFGKVKNALDKCKLIGKKSAMKEVRAVGSFKKGILLAGKPEVEIVAILTAYPTAEILKELREKVEELLSTDECPIKINVCENVFSFALGKVSVIVRVTTSPQNIALHGKTEAIRNRLGEGLAAIRHTLWFQGNANHITVKSLARLLADLQTRIDGLKSMTPWMKDILAHYSIFNQHSGRPLTLVTGFKRALQLLAAGIFLPGSQAIQDPCEARMTSVARYLTLQQMDDICNAAQMLVRLLGHGKVQCIIEGAIALDSPMSIGDDSSSFLLESGQCAMSQCPMQNAELMIAEIEA